MVTIIKSSLLMKNSERLNTLLVSCSNAASKYKQNLDLNRCSLAPEPVFLIFALPFYIM